MQQILPYIQMILSIILIGAVLLQQRGSSLGSSFGGDSSTYSSRRGIEKTLFITTVVVGALFFISNLIPLFLR